MADASKPIPYTYAYQFHNCIRFSDREVNGERPISSFPLYDQKTVDELNNENLALTRALYEFETDYREQEKEIERLKALAVSNGDRAP